MTRKPGPEKSPLNLRLSKRTMSNLAEIKESMNADTLSEVVRRLAEEWKRRESNTTDSTPLVVDMLFPP